MHAVAGEVILSVAEADAGATLRRLARVPPGCARVEIRADRLRAAEIPGLVAASPRPVLVAARRPEHGGAFAGTEEQRAALIAAALSAGAWVDVEWGSALAELAEGPDGARVVLSHHGGPCAKEALLAVYREMARSRAGHLKIVPRAERASEGPAARHLLAEARKEGRALACFALGEAAAATRILALAWGSWATYGSAGDGAATAEGQIPARALLEVYTAPALREESARYALLGSPLAGSPSPALHHAGYRALGLDACYLPLPAADAAEAEAIVAGYGLRGFGVTIPLKEALAARCRTEDPVAAAAGAVNTVRVGPDGWTGHNTDGPAACALLAGMLEPGCRVLVLGAGGTAAGIGAALRAARAEVTVCGRTSSRARALARRIGATSLPWEERGDAAWDVLVQATPLGRAGEEVLPAASLTGRIVLDAAYGESQTPLVAAARARGLPVRDGRDLLREQGARQFALLTGRALPAAVRLPQGGAGRS